MAEDAWFALLICI